MLTDKTPSTSTVVRRLLELERIANQRPTAVDPQLSDRTTQPANPTPLSPSPAPCPRIIAAQLEDKQN